MVCGNSTELYEPNRIENIGPWSESRHGELSSREPLRGAPELFRENPGMVKIKARQPGVFRYITLDREREPRTHDKLDLMNFR